MKLKSTLVRLFYTQLSRNNHFIRTQTIQSFTNPVMSCRRRIPLHLVPCPSWPQTAMCWRCIVASMGEPACGTPSPAPLPFVTCTQPQESPQTLRFSSQTTHSSFLCWMYKIPAWLLLPECRLRGAWLSNNTKKPIQAPRIFTSISPSSYPSSKWKLDDACRLSQVQCLIATHSKSFNTGCL